MSTPTKTPTLSPDDPFWKKLSIPDSGTVVITPKPVEWPTSSPPILQQLTPKEPPTLPVENSPFIQRLEDGIEVPSLGRFSLLTKEALELYNKGLTARKPTRDSLYGRVTISKKEMREALKAGEIFFTRLEALRKK